MAERNSSPVSSDDEGFERELNRHRGDEQRTARAEVTARLADRGISVSDADSIETVVEALEAIESFERAVESQGGDLMVDTPPSHQPDNARFVLPRRGNDESLQALALRIRSAARQLAPRRDD
jgi:hypothetical protein